MSLHDRLSGLTNWEGYYSTCVNNKSGDASCNAFSANNILNRPYKEIAAWSNAKATSGGIEAVLVVRLFLYGAIHIFAWGEYKIMLIHDVPPNRSRQRQDMVSI